MVRPGDARCGEARLGEVRRGKVVWLGKVEVGLGMVEQGVAR